MSQENIAFVQQLYGMFGAGDIGGLMDKFTDDATWTNQGPEADFPTYFGKKTGKEGILGIFAFIGANYDFSVFNPHTFFESGDQVAVIVRLEATIRPTGKSAAFDGVHIWTITDGKVTAFQDFQDSDQLARALKANN